MGSSLLTRLDARDRALFARWTLVGREAAPGSRLFWLVTTHCGGLWSSVAAALAPLAIPGPLRAAGERATAGLALSHLVVQIVKRFVARQRPSRTERCATLVEEPPCFSFPSGHATASMAVAFAYASAFPTLAAPLLVFAIAVGFSRVRLGVHYPADVLAGQLIAIGTDLAVFAWS
ncbi:MAG TPA: phosphatase PAP2 family protein [Gemmatimonadaceae bacterium]|nr:phosphatase PAP2 family protein [Gemmatimonadaceae bacterium]